MSMRSLFAIAGLVLLAACADTTAPTPIETGGTQRQGPSNPCPPTGVDPLVPQAASLQASAQVPQCVPNP